MDRRRPDRVVRDFAPRRPLAELLQRPTVALVLVHFHQGPNDMNEDDPVAGPFAGVRQRHEVLEARTIVDEKIDWKELSLQTPLGWIVVTKNGLQLYSSYTVIPITEDDLRRFPPTVNP